MSKYKLCWWEDNGYHDSYFHGVYFDQADGKCHGVSLGATAYCGGIGFTEEYRLPTPEIVELARVELAEIIFQSLRAAEHKDVLEPCVRNVKRGIKFRLLEPHSVYVKLPNGKGFFLDAKGKRIKRTFAAGTTFVSRSDEAVFYGTQYRKGYNRPHRFNASLSTSYRDEGGSTWFIQVPLEKLRQDCEPIGDEELRARAQECSTHLQFGAAFGCKAWETENWAKSVSARTAD